MDLNFIVLPSESKDMAFQALSASDHTLDTLEYRCSSCELLYFIVFSRDAISSFIDLYLTICDLLLSSFEGGNTVSIHCFSTWEY